MIGSSFLFASSQSPGLGRWDDRQAAAYQQAASRLHELSHEAAEAAEANEGGEARVHEELAAARAKYDALRSQLDSARRAPVRLAAVLRWAGIALSMGGVLVYIVVTTSEP
jgi:hypothetical protein